MLYILLICFAYSAFCFGPVPGLPLRSFGLTSCSILEESQMTLSSSSLLGQPSDYLSLDERTTQCLDFNYILNELQELTVTLLGRELSLNQSYSDVDGVRLGYDMIKELQPQLEELPLRSDMNLWDVLRQIDIGGAPEREELVLFAGFIEEIVEIVGFLIINADKMPLFNGIASSMMLPEKLLATFQGAFDDDDDLSADKYPHIGNLRQQVKGYKAKILQTIKGLLSSDAMRDKLADSGYIEMDGRYCIMLKNTYKKGSGIVHGFSNTGRSIYVEPTEVIQTTNDLKVVQAALKREENAIFFEMCKTIAEYRDSLKVSLHGIADLDVLRAKAMMGMRLNGVIPDVGDEGVIRVVDAKHPILLLRGVDPIGNSIELNSTSPGLVISGPNAGGKTIVLKTVGLQSLMVRHAIPIPAKYGARVDLMDVMADIGDIQTVSGDLSTFSGHLVVCREMLKRARSVSYPLVLLDEIGTGTDPAQGAALAEAVLESLVHSNSRIIVTTHYQRIKELAADDTAFQIAAMEFRDNRPTYRLRMGSVGESFALEAGKRLGLPSDVLERAETLLDDESRRLVALQKCLEEEVALALESQEKAEALALKLEIERQAAEYTKKEVEDELTRIRDGETLKYLADLKQNERQLHFIMREAKNAAIKGSMKEIENIQKTVIENRIETERKFAHAVAEKDDLATPLVTGEPIEEGTALIVLEPGNMFGTRGIVTRRNKGRGRVLIRVGGVEAKFERHILGLPKKSGILGFSNYGGSGAMKEKSQISAKDRRLLEILESELVDPDALLKNHRKKKGSPRAGMRLKSNTFDASGYGFDDVKPKISDFIERIVTKNEIGVLYIHHGAGKKEDALKMKMRTWISKHPLVRSTKAASQADGGNSYTYVELDMSH
jgi:DNA mismatch repair protein MutS2